MKRGSFQNYSLGASLHSPDFQRFVSSLHEPVGARSLVACVEINPRVDIAIFSDDTAVGFIPMEAVSDGATGEYSISTVPLGQVRTNYTRFTDGDVLWAKITPSMQNGKSCVVEELPGGLGFGSTEFHVLRPRSEDVSARFVMEFLSQDTLRRFATYAFTGTAGQQRVPKSFLESLPFPSLSRDRQDELVAAMGTARAERRAKLMEAEGLLAGLDDFVLGELGISFPPEDNRRVFAVKGRVSSSRFDPFFYSPNFVRNADALSHTHCEFLGEIVSFSKEVWRREDHTEPTFRYIEISRVSPRTGRAMWSEVATLEAPSRARMQVQPNDIIISLTRPHHGSIALLSSDFEGCIASTGFAVAREIAQHVSPEYLWCVLRAQVCLMQMLQRSSGGNYPAITEPELANIIVPVPATEVQNAIADEVRNRHHQAALLRAEAEAGWQEAKEWFEEQLLGA